MCVFISICIGVSILLMAFFAGIEVAFANANRLSIELKKKQGSTSGLLLSKLLDEPSRFIGTVLVGFNFFLVIFVLLVSVFWNKVLDIMQVEGSIKELIRVVAEILASMVVVVIFCDFIPKAIFRAKSDGLLSFFARSGLLGFFP